MQPLHITDFGVFLGKHSERLVVRRGKETLEEHPLLHLEQVLVSGRGVCLSTDLMEACCARGIPVTLLTPSGKPYARVASTALTATVRTRREQVAAYLDARGARLAREIAAGKLVNQANLLRYFGKYRKRGSPGKGSPRRHGDTQSEIADWPMQNEKCKLTDSAGAGDEAPGAPHAPQSAVFDLEASNPAAFSVSPCLRGETKSGGYDTLSKCAASILALAKELRELPGETIDELRPALMNREGRAGALYWRGVAALLKGKATFNGREHRGAGDPVNAALNYGYGILQSQVWSAVTLAGLEPFAGFIHVDRPGKPSLVLDLMEEFRQPVVDRPLLAGWGRGWQPEMETPEGEDDASPRMTKEGRQAVAARVLERLETAATYEGKRQSLKSIIQLQARRAAVVVRGEAEYRAFAAGW